VAESAARSGLLLTIASIDRQSFVSRSEWRRLDHAEGRRTYDCFRHELDRSVAELAGHSLVAHMEERLSRGRG